MNSTTPFTEGNDNPGVIENVREGMEVVDANGDKVGKVDQVQMGDPDAATVDTGDANRGGFLNDVGDVFGFGDDPDVPQTLSDRLMRVGYLKVGGNWLTGSGRYISAENVATVTGDTVHLSVSKDQLKEG